MKMNEICFEALVSVTVYNIDTLHFFQNVSAVSDITSLQTGHFYMTISC